MRSGDARRRRPAARRGRPGARRFRAARAPGWRSSTCWFRRRTPTRAEGPTGLPSRRSTRNIRTLAIAASSDAESFSMNSATRSICGCCQPCAVEPEHGGQIERRHEQRRHHGIQGGELALAGADHPVGPRLEVGDVAVGACRLSCAPGRSSGAHAQPGARSRRDSSVPSCQRINGR